MEIYLIHFIFFKIAIDIENESKQQNKYLDGMVIMLLCVCVCVFFYVKIQLFKFQNYTTPTHLLDWSKQLTDFSSDHIQ